MDIQVIYCNGYIETLYDVNNIDQKDINNFFENKNVARLEILRSLPW